MKLSRIVSFSYLFTLLLIGGCSGGSNSGSGGGGGGGNPQPPSISSISPKKIPAGTFGTTLTVTGSNFLSTSVVEVGGTIESTTYVNATELTAFVPPGQLTTGAELAVIVVNGSVNSGSVNLEVDNPVPTLSPINPDGSAINTAATVTLNGTGFVSTSTVAVNGVTVPSTVISPTEMTCTVPASLLTLPGLFNFTVTNPTPGGGTSTPQTYTAYVALPNNSMVYNPLNGLFYLTVPSSAGAPYGNTVVSIDPLTGVLGTPIPVGSEPDKVVITADGKYLWVTLDGAFAIRQVDLQTGTAGMQFSITPEGIGNMAAAAIAALPGSDDSVIVSTSTGLNASGQFLAIYDSGVVRGTPIEDNPWALLVDGSSNEIYAAGSVSFGETNYNTYTYSSSGLTPKASSITSVSYASQNNDEMTIANGLLYTDFGQVANAETGAPTGTFYSSGNTVAQGSTAIDTTPGLAFVLEGYWGSNDFGLQAFNLSDFNATSASPIAIYNPTFRPGYEIQGPSGNRLTRWGADGLAFRTTGGFVSLRTSMVQDLSGVNADLGVSISASGASSTGGTTTYTTTITNNGPSPATSIAMTAMLPTTGLLSSVTASSGYCSTSGGITCNLGGLSSGKSATVSFKVLETTAGSAVTTVQVSASENDPNFANNQATSTLNITGSGYSVVPTLSAISPQGIVSGSSDSEITLTGANFVSGSTVLLNGTALNTSFSSSTELTALVPQANLAKLGWSSITVSNPTPGGGISAPLPLSVFSVLSMGANHILYDPYTRLIMASIGAGTTTIPANTLVAITPDSASIGTPLAMGGTPTNMALTSDGQILYTLVPGSSTGSVARFNMLTQQPDFTVSGFQDSGYNAGLRDIATLPGTENTIALDQGEGVGITLYDFDPSTQTATARGSYTGAYTGTCLAFPNPSTMVSYDLYTSPSALNIWSVTAGGLVLESGLNNNLSILQNVNCYKQSDGLLFSQAGGVANDEVIPAVQVGTFEGLTGVSDYGTGVKDLEPDTSLGVSFYLTDMYTSYEAIFDSITTFNNTSFMPVSTLTLPFGTYEGGNNTFTGVDVFRWGQDGLAVLSSGGNVYLVRGGAIVPELMSVSSAASLTSSSSSTIAHGSGNVLLTLTGTNLLPGVAVTWNGSYRTTTVVSSTQVTVAIPASDLVNIGSASLVATNPGASGSNALQITIN